MVSTYCHLELCRVRGGGQSRAHRPNRQRRSTSSAEWRAKPRGQCCLAALTPDASAGLVRNRSPSIAVKTVMKTQPLIGIFAAGMLAAGCGSVAAVSATEDGTSAPASAPPTTSAPASSASVPASSAGVPASSAGAAARCRKAASLPAGAAVQAWRLGAIRFVSADKGVALTAPQIECDVPLRHGWGTEVYFRPQPVRLATTSDGGRHWVTSGTELPVAPPLTGLEQVAAVDGDRIWVVSLTGTLLVTGNTGASWAVQPLPARVLAAGSAGGWLWALSCPPATSNSCRPDVERMKLPAGTWRASRPASSTSLEPQLDVLSATAAVVVLQGIRPGLASTTDGGVRWTLRAAPAGPEDICRGPSPLFTAAGLRNWWLLCTGGAAAGSSAKTLMRSAVAGQTWTVAASVPSLSAPIRPGSLPRQDAAAITAGSAEVLWLATPNSVTVSTDGGARWRQAISSPQGTFGQFDVQFSTQAWLLAPDAGLWHTADGTTWHSVGGVAP